MAARKLQGEIERTLKKINEGIIEFEGVLNKVRTASTSNQKDKHEADLKRDIKKLQRLREQVKAWISGNEVKNKAPLLDARKRIETQMETFKAYEREAKTKAYSKEGLQRQREKELKGEEGRRDISDWLQDRIEELKRQIEQLEGEIEVELAKKKKGSVEPSREKLERQNFHLDSLEKLLRMWDNVAIDRDTVEGIKDDIDYYVDCNMTDDFMENDAIYDGLGLDDFDPEGTLEHDDQDISDISDAEGDLPIDGDDDSHHDDDEYSNDEAYDESPLNTATSSSSHGKDYNSSNHAPIVDVPSSLVPKPEPIVATKVEEKEPTVTKLAAATTTTPVVLPLDPTPAEAARAKIVGQPTEGQPPQVVTVSPVPVVSTPTQQQPPQQVQPQIGANIPSTATTPAVGGHVSQPVQHVSQPVQHASQPASVQPIVVPSNQMSSLGSNQTIEVDPSLRPAAAAAGYPGSFIRPPPQSGMRSELEMLEMTALKASSRYPPEAEPTRVPYKPRTPTVTPPYYPNSPVNSLMDDPAIVAKFPADTLFFLFYFQQNTYQQYLAARELKRQSWRYHTKYLTWFMRHEDPKTITADYEQGTYVYFDYETGWCQRKKSEFTFQYHYLEDNELP